MTDLGTLSYGGTSVAKAINGSGVVAGTASTANGYHAFIYSGGKMQDLNTMIPTGSVWCSPTQPESPIPDRSSAMPKTPSLTPAMRCC